MSKDAKVLTYTRQVAAPPAHVYHAFTTAAGLQEWFADAAEADARPGGRFYCWWNDGYYTAGLFEKAEENSKIVFTWNGLGDAGPSKVKVLMEEKDGGTLLTIKQKLLGAGEAWDKMAKDIDDNWPPALDNLQSVVETGVDKRLFDRPMLGFFIGGLVDENLKERLGIPVDKGMHVSGVLDDMGAQRSGLQQDDVIHAIEGVVIDSFQAIAPIVSGRKGGDVVKTEVYRGAEKIDLEIELSSRPVPEFPPAPDVLAAFSRKLYAELVEKLEAILEGASEAAASYSPGEDEWSAKQTIAHLLVSERWAQVSLDVHAEGGKHPAYPGSARTVQAIAKTYALDELLTELRFSIENNNIMLETLPEAYSQRKGAYFSALNNYEQSLRSHWEPHLEQIKDVLEKARAAEATPA